MQNWSKFLFTRVIGLVFTLFIIVTISFFIIRLAPGGPFDKEKALPPATIEALRAKYNLDDPTFIQYVRYIGSVIRGDLGPSMQL